MQEAVPSIDRTRLLDAAIEATRRAGRYLKGRFGAVGESAVAERHDVKLEEDHRAEEIIRHSLCDISNYGFIGEESFSGLAPERSVWVVDPLDGSANYMRGIPHYASSIALLEDGVPVLGVVRNHATDEAFTAISGEGALCNDLPIRVAPTSTLERSVMSGGFMKTDEMVERNLAAMTRAVRRTFKLRVTGAAALDLCSVACGRFDIYSEKGIRLWDIAAGMLIAKEAGASVSLSHVDEVSFDVTVLTHLLESEYMEAFPDTALFSSGIPRLMERS